MKKIFTAFKHSLDGVYFIDKILILYMMILLTYIAVHILCPETMQESTVVDVIIRTSASAIFGYFISNNFIKSNSDTNSQNISVSNLDTEILTTNEIVINQVDNPTQTDVGNMDSEKDNKKITATDSNVYCSRIQIIVVSGIGLISLVLLLISRNNTQTTQEFSANISQLRDFLSACIGFLVSCGKAK